MLQVTLLILTNYTALFQYNAVMPPTLKFVYDIDSRPSGYGRLVF